ncbi:MAG: hypothetical protein Kow0025_09500 [Thermodesulfovibrionales bacterium]
MSRKRFLCLRCGLQFSLAPRGEAGASPLCPGCKGDNVVETNPSAFLELLTGRGGGGGG